MSTATTTSNPESLASETAAQPVSIGSLTLEVPDPQEARAFYSAAFDLGDQLRLCASEAPTSGFRGFTVSLVVSQPAIVDALIGTALDAGATPLKPVPSRCGATAASSEPRTGRSGRSLHQRRRTPAPRVDTSTRSCSCSEPQTSP